MISDGVKRSCALLILSVMFLDQAAMAQTTTAVESSSPTTTAPAVAPVIDSAVACIIARELAEGALFVMSHFGAVIKHPNLSQQEKLHYLKAMVPAVISGVVLGAVISIAVGFGIARATSSLNSVSYGVELGEAISKLIGAYFVAKLSLKIPKWMDPG